MTTKKVREPAAERAAPAVAAGEADAPEEAHEVGEVADAESDKAVEDTPTSADYSTAFSPRNVAVGLAIVAGLVAFAASRRRRKPSGRGDS